MRILLTNDDGIYAKGLAALYTSLSAIAECLVVAPEVEQSAVGHAITISRPLMVREVRKNGYFFGYAVTGTPADCVKLGVKELSNGPVDLVVSGINRGANVGINVIYSGTVSAATEGLILGIPSLAISLDSHREADFTFAAEFAKRFIQMIAKRPVAGVALNVNVPALPAEEIKGVVVVKQGRARLVESFERRVDPREHVYYWLAGETLVAEDEAWDSDASALKRGYITVTPLHCDLTRHDMIEELGKRISDVLL
ncbi:MAG: 5'/3'-nucleotidase SurE [Syntrophales bacterium]|nr:5'/3'-nucleotidase SurE [Syntrophales bacterium]